MAPIPARQSYSAPTAPMAYSANWFRTQLTRIAQALLPAATRTVTSATMITIQDDTILADATTAPFTVTLLPADQCQFLKVTVKRLNSGANAVTIGGTVDGAVNPMLSSQYAAMTIQSDGTSWWKLAAI